MGELSAAAWEKKTRFSGPFPKGDSEVETLGLRRDCTGELGDVDWRSELTFPSERKDIVGNGYKKGSGGMVDDTSCGWGAQPSRASRGGIRKSYEVCCSQFDNGDSEDVCGDISKIRSCEVECDARDWTRFEVDRPRNGISMDKKVLQK
jgi:hypothetical protein